MAFVKRTWKNRNSQYPSRRTLTRVDTQVSAVYDVTREEGTVTQEGDDFSAENMNDLESRIKNECDSLQSECNDLAAAIAGVSGGGVLYGTCPTSASTTAKIVTTTDGSFTLTTGKSVFVKFTYANTASSPTLTIDGKTATAIRGYGTTKPDYWWKAGDVVEFVYDGSYFIMQPSQGQITTLNASLSAVNVKVTAFGSYASTDHWYKGTLKNNRVIINGTFATPAVSVPALNRMKFATINSQYAPVHNTWGVCYSVDVNGNLNRVGGCYVASDGFLYYSIGSTTPGPLTFVVSISYDLD